MLFQNNGPQPAVPFRPCPRTPAAWLLIVTVLLLAWDGSGADAWVMQQLGTEQGFPWRNHWFLTRILHDGLRQLGTVFLLLLTLWAVWPDRWSGAASGWLPRRERGVLVGLVLLSLLAVNLLKMNSLTSCPWELKAFGGQASYVSHWRWGQADGGPGRCFPGGHASSAFSFLGLCLPWLEPAPGSGPRRRQTGWMLLLGVLGVGLIAGATQTLRGAHYPSHTGWTLVVCGAVSLLGWKLAGRWLAGARR